MKHVSSSSSVAMATRDFCVVPGAAVGDAEGGGSAFARELDAPNPPPSVPWTRLDATPPTPSLLYCWLAHLRTLPRAWARERVTTPVQPCGCRRECTSAVNFVFYAILREAVGNCESEGDAVSERAKAHSPLRVMVRGASW